jgi:RNase adaptor protein for sRNA GlmZ degradation
VYLDNLTTKFNIDSSKFLKYYPAFILIRILQALGAYGYRGYFEKKSHFLLSIPFALDNLRMLRTQKQIDFGLNSLMKVIDLMTDQDSIYYKQIIKLIDDKDHLINEIQNIKTSTLTIRINSFSYKKAIPDDRTGNGGGFVFDCRALPNPGRFDQYKEQTGRDQDVIDFLKNESSVKAFLNNVYALVNQSVEVYKQRGFENLMVSFGCTGGRHRSVYCAENLASYLSENPYIKIVLRHIEQEY